MLFEVKAALIDVEERLRRPDSAGGPPNADGKAPAKGGGRKGASKGGREQKSSPARPVIARPRTNKSSLARPVIARPRAK